MALTLDPLQELVLDQCREWADGFASVRSVSVFGSVGRGDYQADSDIDLYFDFDTSNPLEFQRGQEGLILLQTQLTQATNHPVSVHCELFDDPVDDASSTVRGAILVTSRGKAQLLSAPKSSETTNRTQV
jgi:predicted nucleotidyltransferase